MAGVGLGVGSHGRGRIINEVVVLGYVVGVGEVVRVNVQGLIKN